MTCSFLFRALARLQPPAGLIETAMERERERERERNIVSSQQPVLLNLGYMPSNFQVIYICSSYSDLPHMKPFQHFGPNEKECTRLQRIAPWGPPCFWQWDVFKKKKFGHLTWCHMFWLRSIPCKEHATWRDEEELRGLGNFLLDARGVVNIQDIHWLGYDRCFDV